MIVFDLDGTLGDHSGRDRFFPIDPKSSADWEDYHLQGIDDPPIEGVVKVAQLLAPFHHIVILTARCDTPKVREQTAAWLDRNGIDFDELILMPLDGTSVRAWKAEIVKTLQPDLVVEDNVHNCVEIEKLGVPCLRVAALRHDPAPT